MNKISNFEEILENFFYDISSHSSSSSSSTIIVKPIHDYLPDVPPLFRLHVCELENLIWNSLPRHEFHPKNFSMRKIKIILWHVNDIENKNILLFYNLSFIMCLHYLDFLFSPVQQKSLDKVLFFKGLWTIKLETFTFDKIWWIFLEVIEVGVVIQLLSGWCVYIYHLTQKPSQINFIFSLRF